MCLTLCFDLSERGNRISPQGLIKCHIIISNVGLRERENGGQGKQKMCSKGKRDTENGVTRKG